MKSPPRSFTVEVKRTRSNPIGVRLPAPERSIAEEAAPPLAPSQARKMAEQLFSSLTTAPSVKPSVLETAESVFRAPVKPERTEPAPRIHEAIVVEPPAPPAAEAPRPKVGRPKGSKAKVSKAAEPTLELPGFEAPEPKAITPKIAKPKAPKAKTPKPKAVKPEKPAFAVEEPVRWGATASPAPRSEPAPVLWGSVEEDDEVLSTSDRLAWAPGQRWKRRLRHLR